MSRARLTSLALALAAPSVLLAQSATTSALQGVVRDPGGSPIKQAVVRIQSPVLIGGERTARTSDTGAFRFPLLPPGTYTLVAEAPGLKPFRATESLNLGETTTANIRMAAEAAAVVEISDTLGTVEGASANVNLSTETLQNLPVGRDLTQVAALTPGVTTSDYTSGAAVRAWGGDGAANAYTIDGLNVGDAKSGEKWVYANPDWFSQVQIGGLGAGAEHGGYSGALINAVVKNGGNEFHGVLSAYYERNSWAALRNNPRIGINPDTGVDERPLYDGTYSSISLSVGGPILPDRLWYFVSAEANKDSATDSPVGVTFPVKLDNPRYLGKLTWQVTPSASWDAFVEFDAVDRDNKYGTRYYTHEAAQRQESPSRLFTTSWTQTLNQSSVLTLRFSTLNARDDRKSYAPNGYTMEVSGSTGLLASVNTAGGTIGTAFPELVGRSYWGNVRRSDLLRQNFRGRNTLSGTYDLFLSGLFSDSDSHALRMGFEVEQSTNEERRWIASPNGIAYRTRVSGGNLQSRRAETGRGRELSTRMDRDMVYLQDTWTVNSRLQIRPGLRYETFQGRPFGGGNLWDTKTLAPRLGFTFNVTEDARQVAKLHFGKYYAGMSSDYFQRAIPGAYQNTNVFFWGSNTLVNPRNPTLIPVDTTIGGADYFYAYNFNASKLDPKHRQPYTNEALFGYDLKVGKLWALGLTAVYRSQKDILVQNDPGWNDPAYTASTLAVTSPITGQTYTTYISDMVLGDPNNGHVNLIANAKDAKNDYRMLTFSAERALSHGWSFYGALTWAKAEGNYSASAAQSVDNFNDPNVKINDTGKLPFVNDREGRLRVAYEFPWAWKTHLATTFTYLSGERFTPLIDMSNVFELNQNALTINAAPRGSARYPSRHLLDLRITQDLNFTKAVKAEAFLDVFNVLNDGKAFQWNELVSDDSGARNSAYQEPIYTDNPRRLRFGFKLKF